MYIYISLSLTLSLSVYVCVHIYIYIFIYLFIYISHTRARTHARLHLLGVWAVPLGDSLPEQAAIRSKHPAFASVKEPGLKIKLRGLSRVFVIVRAAKTADL